MDNELIIYADGACSGNPGPGGWGYVALQNDAKVYSCSGSSFNTTNNRMELTSAIEALMHICDVIRDKNLTTLKIIMDSQYVIKGITTWVIPWKQNNWKTVNKKPVVNKELWMILDLLTNHIDDNVGTFSWAWVKGHDCDKWNEYADFLATSSIVK
jgi:ribonuclease HI